MARRKNWRSAAAKKGWRKRRRGAGRPPRRRISRKKRQWISKKIRYLIVHEGRSSKQAAAIAYRMAGIPPRAKRSSRRKRRR